MQASKLDRRKLKGKDNLPPPCVKEKTMKLAIACCLNLSLPVLITFSSPYAVLGFLVSHHLQKAGQENKWLLGNPHTGNPSP